MMYPPRALAAFVCLLGGWSVLGSALPEACAQRMTPGVKPPPERIVLWPQGAPGAKGKRPQDVPELWVYPAPPEHRTGVAVVVCPGGGYGFLAVGHEGRDVARWLNRHGIHAFVLKYRIAPDYRHPAPSDDAKRAVRLVRHLARRWQVDPQRVGILGFSAGGHLASTVLTHFDTGEGDSPDPVQRQSCRPDFGVLIYPVISLVEPFTHRGSRRNLLGEKPDPKLVQLLSNEKQVTSATPPTFLVASFADKAVPAQNALAFYQAMLRAGVPGELHVFEPGRHGFGLGGNHPQLRYWPELCIRWLRGRGVLPGQKEKHGPQK